MMSLSLLLITSSILKADIPIPLQPKDEPNCFYCLSESEARSAQKCFEELKGYQAEISGEDSSVWEYVLFSAAAGLAVGITLAAKH